MSLCLVVDDLHPSWQSLFQEADLITHYRPDLMAAEVPAALAAHAYEGLVVRGKVRVTAALLAHGPALRYVARAGAGVDNIDEAAMRAAGVTLLNAPEGNRDAVGEFALGLLLALLRNIPRADQEVRQAIWQREANRGEELGGKVVGILGYGNMGRAFAQRLMSFGCTVLAHDNDSACLPDHNATLVTLHELQQRAEVLSLHIPYSVLNHHFVNEAMLLAFRNPIWVLNTARGEVLDQAALVRGLQSGQVRGAALDVLENEKLATLTPTQQATFDFLKNAPQVLLSPHIGGWTHQSYQHINEVLAQKIGAFLRLAPRRG
ncbi:D-isomer specific 2-hydroxyacid dehydrogenase NAD-binding [Hymenobacter roseosalivarius DSM 11622]|uniref:D-isomer specific 2-hydroxyacid dehydrogenase NAD-binding n=1 Tax=Hymenobacter roseosalivarius DSM 11622 TaxID=645990 RepID=A0A1W1W441_9BACT|nr:NAD(P)-dependent oxidoreductase [Hymenobacter roseosalivarius]SMC00366.1 D-isomer specific 2-hydroxyacid dehydrogenase NAD-binding [Hymenobacter roseosalivarius DSM 11622]